MTHSEIARTFDAWAALGRAEEMERRNVDVTQQVLAAMSVKPGMRLLDLGCGGGWAARLLGKKAPGAQAIGVDVSPGMIARAEATSDWTSRARFECMAFEALAFDDARFDRVLAVEALDHALDLAAAVRELFRVTKPGGTLDVLLERYAESPASAALGALGAGTVADGGPGRGPETGGRGATSDGDPDPLPARAWLGEAQWCELLVGAGFASLQARRVRDSRGAAAPILPWLPAEAQAAADAAGRLWLRAERP